MSFILICLVLMSYLMIVAKRMTALVRAFRAQSLCLCIVTFGEAMRHHDANLYSVAVLLFVIKVIAIPTFVYRIMERIHISEPMGLFLNTQLSLVAAVGFTYCSWLFATRMLHTTDTFSLLITVAFTITIIGLFIMMFRMNALAQIMGLLVMENGLFLLASSMSGGMPFFVEIAIFFDVFMSVIILGIFVYRINRLFTHIDVDKLSRLRG